MSKFKLQVYLNSYSDAASSNEPNLNHFKWLRDVAGIQVSDPKSLSCTIAPLSQTDIFSGTVALDQDLTTRYDLALQPGTSNYYTITHVLGQIPNFRQRRDIGIDETSELTIEKSGATAVVTFTNGQLPDLTSVQVGDVFLNRSYGSALNQGQFKILSKTANSLTLQAPNAIDDLLTLDMDFMSDLKIFSATGVQKGDKVVINSGFSSASFGTYEIFSVEDDRITFFSTKTIPAESSIQSAIIVYSNAKRFLYIESQTPITAIVNGQEMPIAPLTAQKDHGILLVTNTCYSLSIKNDSFNPAIIFIASAE